MNNIGIFLIVVGILFLIIGGISLASGIKDTITYMLYWFMYLISIATFGNILLTIYYYYIMKDKTGPRGSTGPRGDMGNIGKDGQCNTNCRNQICVKGIKDNIVEILNNLEKNDGNYNTDFTTEDLRNLYIKEKINSMCQSTEFQQLIPYKGAKNLIAYMSNIWGKVAEDLYNSGGVNYFKTIGAENDWDWLEENPWNEFKKYDIYYWGMTKEYRPQIKDKCDNSQVSKAFNGGKYPDHRHLIKNKGKSNYKNPSSKLDKYSIISYINTPTNFSSKQSSDGSNNYTNAYNNKNKIGVKIYNAFTFKPSVEIQQKYETGNNVNKPRKLKPMSYMIAHSKNDNACVKVNKFGSVSYKTCDPYDAEQIFTLKYDTSPNSRMKQFKIINMNTNKEIKHNSSGITTNDKNGDLYRIK